MSQKMGRTEVLDKKALRKIMLSKRNALSELEAAQMSKSIAAAVTDFINKKSGKRLVMLFASYNKEPDTDVLFNNIKETDKNALTMEAVNETDIAYPRVSDNKKDMDFFIADSLFELNYGYMEIREPEYNLHKLIDLENKKAKKTEETSCEYDSIFIIVPGLAFDESGFRIGYGGGFYDRYNMRIAENSNLKSLVYFIGICYDFQLLNNGIIQHESHDMKCDIVITDRRIIING